METFTLQTDTGMVVVHNGTQHMINENEVGYEDALEAFENEDWDTFIELCNPSKVIEEYIENYGDVQVGADSIMYRGFDVHNVLVDIILEMKKTGKNFSRLALFLNKLMLNPDPRCVEACYTFLTKNSLAINEEGDVVGYKAVRGDYLDYHSGTVSNKIGEKPWMPRNMVDPDFYKNCSTGFHIGSLDYSGPNRGFHSHDPERHVMICKFNPKDVVSIPSDCHADKIRVCEYEVIGEYECPLEVAYGDDAYDENDFDYEEPNHIYTCEEEPVCWNSTEESDSNVTLETTFDPFGNSIHIPRPDQPCNEGGNVFNPFAENQGCCQEEEEDDSICFDELEVTNLISFEYDKENGEGPVTRYVRVVDLDYDEHGDFMWADSVLPDDKAGETGKKFLARRMTNIQHTENYRG